LLGKFKKAVKGKSDAKENYEELTTSLPEELISIWLKEESEAMENRGQALKIFGVRHENGYFIFPAMFRN
jgi:hypothetical protein